MIQHYNYPLSAGAKLQIIRNPGMAAVIQSLLQVPGGLTTAELSSQTHISSNILKGYLQKMKQKGILNNAYAIPGDHYKLWWILPAFQNSLSIFIQSVGIVE